MKDFDRYEAMAAHLDAEIDAEQLSDPPERSTQTRSSKKPSAPPTFEVGMDLDTHRNSPRPDPACLYGLVGEVAIAGGQNTEANPYAIAMAFMSYTSVALGRGPFMDIGDDRHHARLFGLHVGRSGRGRKGTATKLVKRIHEALLVIDPYLAPQIHDGGLSSREGLAFLIHDGYTHGQEDIPPIHDKRLWTLEPEFANVMKQTGREGNTLSAALRDCWDGGNIKPATKSSRIWATHTHVGMTGNVTPTELLALLKSRELTNGFGNRFVIYWAEQPRVEPYPQSTPDAVVNTLAQRVAQVLRFVKADRYVEREWLRVEMSPAAHERYAELYRGELRDQRHGPTVNALLERRAPMLLRMAMLFALTDLSPRIEEVHLEAALAWVRYWVDSVKFVFQTGGEEAKTAEIDKVSQRILQFLVDGKQASRTDITRDCFKGHVKKDVIDAALSELLITVPPSIELQEVARQASQPGVKTKIYRSLVANCANSANRQKNQELAGQVPPCEPSEIGEQIGSVERARSLSAGTVRTVRQVRETPDGVQAVDLPHTSRSSPSSHGSDNDVEYF